MTISFRSSAFLLLALSLVLAPGLLRAQHDPQRNATQHIAAERFGAAETELAKADDDDPETRFVRMMLALKQGQLDEAVAQAQAALDAGLSPERLLAGPRDLLAPLRETEAWAMWFPQPRPADRVLLHGPMVGAVSDQGASIWLRTIEAAKVEVRVGDVVSPIVETSADAGFTAVLSLEGLAPDTDHDYEIWIDGERQVAEATRFRTAPAAGGPGVFKVAFGGGAGFVPQWESMWETIRAREPQALLMLGDNVYIDQPERLLTHDYCYLRRQQRPEWRRLTASTAVYAIYDDHDFGTNDCVPGPEIEVPAWKRTVWEKFRENWVNPAYGGGEAQPGCWFDFAIGDVHFILLDGRYYRDRDGGSMLGPVQKTWLKETLANSTATFKVLASPVPWTAGIKPGSKDPWDGFPEEREEIFSFIEAEKIDGVFLIAADRHRTDLRITERDAGYDLYEFESSRLTNRHTHKVVETPGLVWGYSKTCSFGLMSFDTTADDPQVTFECITIDGEVMHDFTLKASQLRH